MPSSARRPKVKGDDSRVRAMNWLAWTDHQPLSPTRMAQLLLGRGSSWLGSQTGMFRA